MKIPKEAKKVFSGVIWDVYHWEQKMFDGEYETFEMLRRPNTVKIIATQGDKIIIGKESQPTSDRVFYDFFCGRNDQGEDELTAAKRELLEESGMVSDEWELLRTLQPYDKIDWKISIFAARNCRKVQNQQLDSGEDIEIKEITFEELVEIVIHENFRGQDTTMEILKRKVQGEDKLQEFKDEIFGK